MITISPNQIKISDKINRNFHSFWKASNDDRYLKIVCKGGRNSAKSTHIAMKIIFDMMKYPVTALCVRKVGNTISESMFEQLKSAINMLGVNNYWEIYKSPMKLVYKPRKNSIIFRGADDPNKIKSIKMADYPIAFLWIEELAEFKEEDEVTTIENSILRAELPKGLHYKFYYSYNPPKRKQHWLNKKYETQFIQSNTYIHHSTYLENPFVAKSLIEEIEEVKLHNEFKYKWEYLGMPIGSGVVPFNNLKFETITDEQIKSFDNIRQGIDWGYATDPVAFARMHYDKTRKILYFIDEFYGVKKSNLELADWIKNKGYNDVNITCDSAEPKSIAEMKSYGLKTVGAKKGPGSVEYGEKWLDDLDVIIIDAKRTPNAAIEFEAIDYQTDKDGNVITKLEDKNNHIIDATRYAMESDMTVKTQANARFL